MPALEHVLYSGQISIGPPVAEFEAAFAELVGVDDMIGVSSGTAALHLALILSGVGPGDEVISTALTAEPTNMAILHAGGRVVWADVDPRNGNLAPESVAAAITSRTKAILVVHYGGIPASLGALTEIAEAHGIPLIEDAAHALGASYGGKRIGGHSPHVIFSLQAIKHMTTVDGGMLYTRSEADRERARLLRWFGIPRDRARTEVDVREGGFKYNMNNVDATIGLTSVRRIEPVLARYIDNGRFYDDAFAGVDGIETCSWDDAAEPSYWFYTVLAESRDELAAHLQRHGIGASLPHARNDKHTVFADSRRSLPHLDEFERRYLHLPCGWWVGDEERERIVSIVRAGW